MDDQSTINSRASPALARPRARVSAVVQFLDLEFDFERDQLRRNGTPISLSPKPSALLRYFLANPQRLVSRAELMESLWTGVVVTDDSLVQCVSELRNRLGEQGSKLIITLPRRGYMFDAEVCAAAADGSAQASAAAAAPAVPARRGMRRLAAAGATLVLLAVVGFVTYRESGSAAFRIDEEIVRRNAIVLVPFSDIGATPAPASVRDGLTDEIAARISELPDASVVRATTAAGARYALNGRIAAHGDRVLVDAQLKSLPLGNIVWAEHVEYVDANDPGSNFEVALKVVSSLRHRLTEIHKSRVSVPGYRFDPADLAISGWDDINHRQSIEDVRRGRKRFEEALHADPDSVIALTGLGAALMSERFGDSGEPLPQDVAESERIAERAIEVAPNNAVALIVWGDVLLFRRQPDVALPVFEKAVLRAPANANAHLRYAYALLLVGRAAEMQPQIDNAMRIGYRDARIMAVAFFAASQAAFALGDEEKAYAMARRSLAERPTFGPSYAMLASIDALHGRKEEAEKNMAEHRRLMPHDSIARYVTNYPAGAASYQVSRDRLCAGMRAAGLPDQ
jgi:DNA-binding winged helix-turn-helix (wHTH) protein/TolB-like protein